MIVRPIEKGAEMLPAAIGRHTPVLLQPQMPRLDARAGNSAEFLGIPMLEIQLFTPFGFPNGLVGICRVRFETIFDVVVDEGANGRCPLLRKWVLALVIPRLPIGQC